MQTLLPPKHPFRKIRVYRAKENTVKPTTAILMAPHRNENVFPFQRKVAAKLRSDGIEIEIKNMPNSMEGPFALRALQEQGGEALLGCGRLLLIEDRLIRARLISQSVGRSTFVLEMHAMADVGANAIFPFAKDYQRLRGTKILVGEQIPSILKTLQDLFNLGLGRPLDPGNMETLRNRVNPAPVRSLDPKKVLYFMEQAAELRGFSLKRAKEELKALVKRLQPESDRLAYIEMPAKEFPLSKESPLYKIYFSSSGQPQTTNQYEEIYCNHTLQMTFGDEEVRKVASIVRIPRN